VKAPGQIALGDDLRSRLRFCEKTGDIWLDEHRMLLLHASAQGSLRKELIETLGVERARGLLTRMGYASGVRDAELARSCRQKQTMSDTEVFMVGPKLHTLEGIVLVTPKELEIDVAKGKFFGKFLWENSWEGQTHRHEYGIQETPACWTQIGYACGYTSAFMGRPILYKEVECCACGAPHCLIVGKPVEEWEDAEEHLRYLRPDSVMGELLELHAQVEQLRSTISAERTQGNMIGVSSGFSAACELVHSAAKCHITVLLLGETGVGKEMFARNLHQLSTRSAGPFVAVNCAAIPHELVESELFGVEKGAYTGAHQSRPGRFERASGGTLFLDELGDLSASAQAKLLRVLQEGEVERLGDAQPRKVDVRLVAATNVNLKQAVKDGRFRADLYYRLNAFPVLIPPLRERRPDIPLLVEHFLEKFSAIIGKRVKGVTDKALTALQNYAWPGNIRELENMIERGILLAPTDGYIEVPHLFALCDEGDLATTLLSNEPARESTAGPSIEDLCEAVLSSGVSLDALEGQLIDSAVRNARGNLSLAARMLGMTRPQLAYRQKRRNSWDPAEAAPSE